MSVEEELKHNQDVMIQLPWTVPQQPLYTANIQVDPETQKIPLDLSHSTDTTAIGSFIVAMVASVVIAIWYGRKSFKLTEMSFETLIEQIRSSEKSASNFNIQLFSHQNELQKTEFNFKWSNTWGHQVRRVGAEYISALTEFLYEAEVFENKYLTSTREQKTDKNSNEGFAYNELISLSKKCFLKAVEIDLYFESDIEQFESVIQFIDLATDTMEAILNEYLTISDRKDLQRITVDKDKAKNEIDNKFTAQELNSIIGAFKINYLSILMRKINLEIKNVVNKKAA